MEEQTSKFRKRLYEGRHKASEALSHIERLATGNYDVNEDELKTFSVDDLPVKCTDLLKYAHVVGLLKTCKLIDSDEDQRLSEYVSECKNLKTDSKSKIYSLKLKMFSEDSCKSSIDLSLESINHYKFLVNLMNCKALHPQFQEIIIQDCKRYSSEDMNDYDHGETANFESYEFYLKKLIIQQAQMKPVPKDEEEDEKEEDRLEVQVIRGRIPKGLKSLKIKGEYKNEMSGGMEQELFEVILDVLGKQLASNNFYSY